MLSIKKAIKDLLDSYNEENSSSGSKSQVWSSNDLISYNKTNILELIDAVDHLSKCGISLKSPELKTSIAIVLKFSKNNFSQVKDFSTLDEYKLTFGMKTAQILIESGYEDIAPSCFENLDFKQLNKISDLILLDKILSTDSYNYSLRKNLQKEINAKCQQGLRRDNMDISTICSLLLLEGTSRATAYHLLQFLMGRQEEDGSFGSLLNTGLVLATFCYLENLGMEIHDEMFDTTEMCFRQSKHTSFTENIINLGTQYALKEHKNRKITPDYVQYSIKDSVRKVNTSQRLYCTLPAFDLSKISEQVQKVTDIVGDKLLEIGVFQDTKTYRRYSYVDGALYINRHAITDKQLYVLALHCVALERIDTSLDECWELYRETPQILEQIVRVFINILKGKQKSIEKLAYMHKEFPIFYPLCKLCFEIRSGIEDLKFSKSSISEFEKSIEEDLNFLIKDILSRLNESNPLDPFEFIEVGKDTLLLRSLLALSCTFNGIPTFDSDHYENQKPLIMEYRDHAFRTGRIAIDTSSFLHDIKENLKDENTVLLFQSHYNCTLEEAFLSAVEYHNDLIFRMLELEELILSSNPEPGNKEIIKQLMHQLKCYTEGSKDWSMRCGKYATGAEINMRRINCIR